MPATSIMNRVSFKDLTKLRVVRATPGHADCPQHLAMPLSYEIYLVHSNLTGLLWNCNEFINKLRILFGNEIWQLYIFQLMKLSLVTK